MILGYFYSYILMTLGDKFRWINSRCTDQNPKKILGTYWSGKRQRWALSSSPTLLLPALQWECHSFFFLCWATPNGMASPVSPPESSPSWTFLRGIWSLNRTPPIFPHAWVTCLCEEGEGGCNEVGLGLSSRTIVFAQLYGRKWWR